MLFIENDGPHIVSTNYWNSALCENGGCFLSWNGGEARLLIPPALMQYVPEIRSATQVIVSGGPWDDMGGCFAYELLFEDNSDNPFCIHIAADQQSDRRLLKTDHGRAFGLSAWTEEGRLFSLPARYRSVTKIPCLSPWNDSEPEVIKP